MMRPINFPERLDNFAIRPLQKDHCSFIARQLCTMEPWKSLGYSPASLENYLLTPDPCLNFRVIVDNVAFGEIYLGLMGVFALRTPWLFGACLELFAIFPHYQKQGMGKKLLATLEKSVCAAMGRNLWILVSAFNQTARNFYLHQGYIEVAQFDDLVTIGFQEVLLRKQLARNNS